MTKIDVRVKKLHEDAVIPVYAHEYDAGFDLYATEDVVIEPGQTKLVPTGLAFQIPIGYELQVRPRSGLSLKTKLRVANSPGTVDSQYRGEVKVIIENIKQSLYELDYRFDENGDPCDYRLTNTLTGWSKEIDNTEVHTVAEGYGYVDTESYIIRKGDRIAQGVLAEVPRANFVVVDELDDSTRGAGGFGSTGVKA